MFRSHSQETTTVFGLGVKREQRKDKSYLTSEILDLFKRNLINLVVAIQASNVLAVPKNHIDKVVYRAIFSDQYFSIVDLVILKDL